MPLSIIDTTMKMSSSLNQSHWVGSTPMLYSKSGLMRVCDSNAMITILELDPHIITNMWYIRNKCKHMNSDCLPINQKLYSQSHAAISVILRILCANGRQFVLLKHCYCLSSCYCFMYISGNGVCVRMLRLYARCYTHSHNAFESMLLASFPP